MKALIPRGSFNAHWFSLFRAGSFQITRGAPVFVYAKSLDASSTVLGLIAALSPLMTIFQLPAARRLGRYGYRRFVMIGWSMRTVLILMIAATPIMNFLDNRLKLVGLLILLLLLNVLRGIFSAAWMPWIAHLIPEELRGRFISINHFFRYSGSLVFLLMAPLVISGAADPWEYSLVFLIAASGGFVTLGFVKRTPDIAAGEATRLSSQHVQWRKMLAYTPFRKLLTFNLIHATVVGSLGVFTVEYLHDFSGFGVRRVLFLSTFFFMGALVVLPLCGPVVDATGSKPLMRVATGMFAIVIATWILIAASVLPCSLVLVAALNFLAGAASANFNLANVRITMSTIPARGRNHFFALFTVIRSLGLGGGTVAWGIFLDALGSYEAVTGVFHWKRHSIYFLVLLALNAIAFAYIPRLHESAGAREGASLLISARSNRLSRFWHR